MEGLDARVARGDSGATREYHGYDMTRTRAAQRSGLRRGATGFAERRRWEVCTCF